MKIIDILAQLKRKTKKSQIVKRSRIITREFRPSAGFFAFFTKIISKRKSLLHNSVQRMNRRQVKAVVRQSHLRAHQTVSASRSKIFAAYRQSFTAAKNLFQQTNIRAKSFWQNKSLVLTLPSIRFYTTQHEVRVPTIVHQSVHRRVKKKPVSIWRYSRPWHIRLSELRIAYLRWLGWTARRMAPLGMAAVYIAVIMSILISGIYPRGIAYAGSTAFDFSTPANYSVSDATKIEVTSNQTQLKSQQYVTDASTSALWHLDEAEGGGAETSATDSSANSNTITLGTTNACATDGGAFATGKIANGITSSSAPGCQSAADSASLSLSGSMTLEALVKFPSAFDKTAGSSQGIIDKGNYGLYLDQGDGKLKFEVESNTAKTWQKSAGAAGDQPTTVNYQNGIAGSWAQLIPNTVSAITEHSGSLYVGTNGTSTANLGTAEVWKYSGSGTTWTKVGGDGNGSSNWDINSAEGVYSLVSHAGALYAGLGSSADDAEIWRYSGSGTTWTKVAGGGAGSSWSNAHDIEFVYSMASDGTFLYAGTGGISATSAQYSDGDVWKCENCGTTPAWTQIGGTNNTTPYADVNSGWGASWANPNNTFEGVRSLVVVSGFLFAGLGDGAAAAYMDAEIWRFNGSNDWTRVAGDGSPSALWASNTYEMVYSMATDGTNLYAGLGFGSTSANDADVWMCTDCTTVPVWIQIGGNDVHVGTPNWNTGYETIRSLVYVDTGASGKLYAGLGDSQGDAEVWQYNTTSWTRVGGDGTNGNSTWDATFTTPATTTNYKEQVSAMGVYGTSLIAGLGVSASDAEVWMYADTGAPEGHDTWSWIGGRDFLSWGSGNLAYVTAMTVANGFLYIATGMSWKQTTIWQYDGTTWTQIGGGKLNVASGAWENYEYVWSLGVYKGDLYAGFGSTADDADVWKYSTGAWTQVGGTTAAGATVNSSWADIHNVEMVVSMAADASFLYVGTGNTTAGSAQYAQGDVWKFDGNTSTWTQIGGPNNTTPYTDVNSSWGYTAGTGAYERVQTLNVANGILFAGLGSSATVNNHQDAEIWQFNGTNDWVRVGGDGVGSSWNYHATLYAHESVLAMTVIGQTLYAGLGDTNDQTNADSEVWACTDCLRVGGTPAWTLVGGDGTGSSWGAGDLELVTAMTVYHGELFVGLGNGLNGSDYDAEVWRYYDSDNNGSLNAWEKIGGDGVSADTWPNGYDETVGPKAMAVYGGRMYAGLGSTNGTTSAADAEVWEYGRNATKVLSSSSSFASWTADHWYHVAATYDGDTANLYVCDTNSIGSCNGTPDATATWGAITLANGSLPLTVGEQKGPMAASQGYSGFNGMIDELRISSAARDPATFIRTWYTTAVQTVQPAGAISRDDKHSWASFSATDNGLGTITYRLSSDGTNWKYWNSGSSAWTTSTLLTESNVEAIINTNIASFDPVPLSTQGLLWQAILTGNGDERVILDDVTVGYVDDTTAPNNVDTATGNDGNWYNRSNPQFSWTAPTDDVPAPNPGLEQASGVEGYYVYFGKDGSYTPSSNPALFQTGTTYTGTAISPSDLDPYYLRIQTRDNAQNISTTVYDQFRDLKAPDNVASITAKSASGGSLITTNTWYGHAAPEFSWTAPDDHVPDPNPNSEIASGIKGYYVYFGSTATAVPWEVGTFQTGTTFVPPAMTSGQTYYLRIQTRDKALNTTSDGAILAAFTYKYDGSGPTPPSTISVSPSGFTSVNSYTFIWPITGASGPSDPGAPAAGSGLKGYQYKTSATTGALSEWSTIVTDGSGEITIPTAADKEGANTFYLRYVDVTDNYSASATATFYYAGSAPGAPLNLQVSPTTTVDTPQLNNSFSFSWDTPAFFNGSIKQYHFSVNKLPTSTNTTSTPFRTLAAAAYATQQGKNTLYVVAEDEAGNKNFNIYASVDFYTSTPAPAPPTALQIFDISNRDTQEYAISMKWTEPTKASGFDGYEVFRSADNVTFTSAGTTKSPVFIDTNLESKTYYFKVKSKDNAGQSSADSTTVNLIPTGRYTSPPTILAAPTIVTKSYSAAIDWDTDRTGSSFVEYGPAADKLGKEKGGDTIGTLDLVTRHVVDLKGLEPETTYYYQAVWVDQDGNRGQSDVLAFKTGLRPKISDVTITNITLTSATINWVSTTVSTSTINYGLTKSFGQVVSDTSGGGTTKHSMQLTDLKDTSNYYFVITGKDLDDNSLSSDDYSFTTLTRPIISDFKFETVKDAPTTAIKFTWNTNVPTTSIVTVTKAGTAPKSQSNSEYATAHEIIIKDLADLTPYSLQAKGVDNYGNNALSETANFTTPDDSRPPKVVNMTVEVRSSGVGATQKAQLIINWETDEPGTSQIEYGPGISSDSYPSKSQEDSALSTTHVVIVPELEPAKLYHFRAVSRDRANNAGTSDDTTSITGKVQRSVVDIIMASLQRSLGFLSAIPGLGSK